MVHKRFQSFLKNEDEYRACERYWKRLLSSIEREVQQEGQWPRWIPLMYADGTPMEMDGNPIFDGRSERLDRAFTIVQHAPTGNEIELAAWLKRYEPEYVDLPGQELVINLSLSDESAAIARGLLQKWMSPHTTFQEMSRYIESGKNVGEGSSRG